MLGQPIIIQEHIRRGGKRIWDWEIGFVYTHARAFLGKGRACVITFLFSFFFYSIPSPPFQLLSNIWAGKHVWIPQYLTGLGHGRGRMAPSAVFLAADQDSLGISGPRSTPSSHSGIWHISWGAFLFLMAAVFPRDAP